MRNVNTSNKTYSLVIFLTAFFLQFVHLKLGALNVKLFMVVGIFLFIFNLQKMQIKKLFNYETFWLAYFFCVLLSSVYAPNKILALQLIIGQFVLIIVYFTFRSLIDKSSLKIIIITLGKYFVFFSIMYYLLAIYGYYLSNDNIIPKNFSIEGSSIKLYGMLLESKKIPRLIGLSESPNNYAYISNFLFWLFLFNGKRMLAFITIISYLLTFSSTAFVVLIAQIILLFFFTDRKKMFNVLFFGLLFFWLVYSYSADYESIQDIFERRIERNKTGSGRLELFEYVWDLITKSPIIGYGANQTRELIRPFRELMSSHNSFLEIFLTTGVLGLISYTMFTLTLIRNSYFLYRRHGNPFCLLITIGFFIFSLTNNTLHIGYSLFLMGYLYSCNKNKIQNYYS